MTVQSESLWEADPCCERPPWRQAGRLPHVLGLCFLQPDHTAFPEPLLSPGVAPGGGRHMADLAPPLGRGEEPQAHRS